MLPMPYGLVLLEEETNTHTSRQKEPHINVTECQKYFLHKSDQRVDIYVISIVFILYLV